MQEGVLCTYEGRTCTFLIRKVERVGEENDEEN